MKKSTVVALLVLTLCFINAKSQERCGPHARYYECKPCRSVPCGTTPPDFCTLQCIPEAGCYCEEGYREKDGKCVLPWCAPHERYYQCKPCRSVPCGTTPPDVCTKECINKPGCYCEEGYRENDGKCVLPCEC